MWWAKYIGKAFEEKGRGPDTFDCWGLARWVYGHDRPGAAALPSYEELYEDTKDSDTLGKLIFDERNKHWNEVAAPKEFDLILLRMRGVGMHVGVVTKPGHMLHCEIGIGTVHERYDSMKWKHRVIGYFRYE